MGVTLESPLHSSKNAKIKVETLRKKAHLKDFFSKEDFKPLSKEQIENSKSNAYAFVY